jgi:hypothetical protein
MRLDAVPPAAIGLAAGLLTSTVAIALSATGLLPVRATTPLLFLAGGLGAGLAAPVRPTIGALLGAVTGIFAAILMTVVYSVQMASVLSPYYSSPFALIPFALITVASVIMYVPVYAVAGAMGAAVRPRLGGLRRAPVEGTMGQALERRQWIGIAAGALCIVVGLWAGLLIEQDVPSALLLVSTFAGGFVAGILSAGGARAGFVSGLLVGVFGLGAIALYFIWQASRATGDAFPTGLWPIALAIMAFWVLPAVALGGALGGSFRRPSPAPFEPDRDGDGRAEADL